MKTTIIGLIGLLIFSLIVVTAGTSPTNNTTINIPQEDIDILKLRYNLTEINPVASSIYEYDNECWFTLTQEGLYNTEIEFDCERMTDVQRLAERDKLITHNLMYLANVTRERIARETGIIERDAGGNVTVNAL